VREIVGPLLFAEAFWFLLISSSREVLACPSLR